MLNERPCKECKNFDRIIAQGKPSRRGRCAIKSIYPHAEGPGQVFPPHVKRAASDALAKPYIVVGAEVEGHCAAFQSIVPAVAVPAPAASPMKKKRG